MALTSNYVMVGTEANPNSVSHVILTAKSEGKEGTPGATSTNKPLPALARMSSAHGVTASRHANRIGSSKQQQQAQEVSTPEFPATPLQSPWRSRLLLRNQSQRLKRTACRPRASQP